ncbi:MAG TPA: hypothetical protein VN616_12100 [Puia sp.]|nr:hypothetical protein [Puia sp.]
MELLIRCLPLVAGMLLFGCTRDPAVRSGVQGSRPRHVGKPPARARDTVRIGIPAAVFFYPDSLQLATVKALLDTSVYQAIMHDYFYQMRYAGKVVRESWPALSTVSVKDHRYLLFVKEDSSRKCIDLDKVSDLYGVCLFDGRKDPALADLPNINTALGFYFKEH